MRNDTRDERTQPEGRPIAAAGERQANRPAAGATVLIPPRPRSAAPFDASPLHAQLALLRPRPVWLRPATGNER